MEKSINTVSQKLRLKKLSRQESNLGPGTTCSVLFHWATEKPFNKAYDGWRQCLYVSGIYLILPLKTLLGSPHFSSNIIYFLVHHRIPRASSLRLQIIMFLSLFKSFVKWPIYALRFSNRICLYLSIEYFIYQFQLKLSTVKNVNILQL